MRSHLQFHMVSPHGSYSGLQWSHMPHLSPHLALFEGSNLNDAFFVLFFCSPFLQMWVAFRGHRLPFFPRDFRRVALCCRSSPRHPPVGRRLSPPKPPIAVPPVPVLPPPESWQHRPLLLRYAPVEPAGNRPSGVCWLDVFIDKFVV